MACPGQGVWWDQLFTLALGYAGAPATANNLAIVERWATYECTAAQYNPLATTTYEPGSPCFNSVCVRNFPSVDVGAHATATTWMNGYYPALLAALRRNADIHEWSCTPIPAEIDVWGTRGFAAYLRTLDGCPGPNPPPPVCTPACSGGAACVNGACTCPAGTGWNGAACVPVAPPGAGAVDNLVPVLALLSLAGLGYWEAQHHRAATAAILREPVAFGGRRDGRPHLGHVPARVRRAPSPPTRGFGS